MDLENQSILVLPHKEPDVDALASAAALAEVSEESSVFLPENPKVGAKKFIESVETDFSSEISLDKDLVIVVDSNSPTLIPHYDEVSSSGLKKVLIDHHHLQFPEAFDEIHSDENAVSTTQIVSKLSKKEGWNTTSTFWFSIAAGIFGDLPDIKLATPESLEVLSEAVKKSDFSLKEISNMTVPERTFSERMACLKSASRMSIDKHGENIIVASESGSYGGSSASSLLELGADIAFVASGKDQIKVSARAVKELEKKGFHLGRDVMPEVKEVFGGDGGGHATAAGAAVKEAPDARNVLDKCVEISKKTLNELGRS